jgi:hypothetical protein
VAAEKLDAQTIGDRCRVGVLLALEQVPLELVGQVRRQPFQPGMVPADLREEVRGDLPAFGDRVGAVNRRA